MVNRDAANVNRDDYRDVHDPLAYAKEQFVLHLWELECQAAGSNDVKHYEQNLEI